MTALGELSCSGIAWASVEGAPVSPLMSSTPSASVAGVGMRNRPAS